MEPSFDLDINNYSTQDLLNFFKLTNTYTLDELAKKEYDLATNSYDSLGLSMTPIRNPKMPLEALKH